MAGLLPFQIITDPFLPRNAVFMSIDPGANGPPVLWMHIDEVDLWGDIAAIEKRLVELEKQLEMEEYVLSQVTYDSPAYWNQHVDVEALRDRILEHRVRLPGIAC